ncbi:unnamed protein product [Closterium sp. NIES-54]
MHERKLKGHTQGSTYADSVKLCRQFARDCVDLGKLGPTKLFRAGKWPKIKAQREKKCKEWLHGCSRLFRHKLPGFDLKAAERELPIFCAIMESHHEMESFAHGLNNFLGSVDSKRRWPNLILLWQALAVLPLSTVGAWSALQRASGGADADIALEVRDRMAGGTGGVEVHAEEAPWENEDEGEEEEEEDDEVEQDLGDDQEVVEEEDNPFLSDDEDVVEVYFIDKPVH